MIIGSTAIRYWFEDYPNEPKDLDILMPYSIQGAETFWFDKAYDIIFRNSNADYLDPDLLYTMKVSHLPWEGRNGKWWKHLKDAVFLRDHGCELNMEVHEILQIEWAKRFGSKDHINLNKQNYDFFNDHIIRKYDHDELHEYFKLGKNPAYKKILKSENSPICSKELFDSLTLNEQYDTIIEEIFVISYERRLSFNNGFKHLVTKMSRGWWNLFIIENAKQILDGFEVEKKQYIIKRNQLGELYYGT